MRTLRRCLLLAWGTQPAVHPLPVAAQTAPPPVLARPGPALAPPLSVEPAVAGTNATITLTLPPNLSGSRWRIGLFEQGRPAVLADAQRDFTPRDGRLQATVTVQADPGAYEVRLISNDRARLPLSQQAPLLVTGIRREPGWWLLNGSPFAELATGPTTLKIPNTPLYLPGLRRDFAHKQRALGLSVAAQTAGPLEWRVVKLPSLRSLLAVSPTELRTRVAVALQAAQNGEQRNYLGAELPVDTAGDGAPLPPTAVDTVAQVRLAVTSLAPDAALILGVDAASTGPSAVDGAVAAIALCAARCDAVVVKVDPASTGSWPVKAARRVAEEQPSYDLPIFVQVVSVGVAVPAMYAMPEYISVLDYFMSGATGIINGGQLAAGWQALFQRDASLFVGSVTLEDTGLLPLSEGLEQRPDAANSIYDALRSARRIPLMAHPLQLKKVPESAVVVLGDRISDAMVQALSATARGGGRLYIEGCPLLDDKGQPIWKLAPLVGATAIAVPAKQTTMVLEDPWTFGLGRGGRIAVEQDVQVKLSPGSLVKTPKPVKGKDVLTGPRVAARLEDGSPAVIVTPVDKGEVVWMPYHIVPEQAPAASAPDTASSALLGPLSSPIAVAIDVNRSTPLQRYYEAIAADLQQSLVQVRGTDPAQAGAEAVRVALRRSAKGALLLAVFNTAQQPAAVSAAVGGVFGVALDLGEEKELPIASRGFSTAAALTIPPQGWKLIAFGESRKALDAERNAPRAVAHLR